MIEESVIPPSVRAPKIKSITPRVISRDEMNLAEFPLTVLSTRADPKTKTLEFKDHVRGKNGDLMERSWIITGADKFGLPTASDDEVLLGLLKLTVDSGMTGRKVVFTRYELMKILRWTTEGRNYSRLQKALDRLSGVRIKAQNGFYDNDTKAHSTKNFGIIDEYEINDGRDERKPSFFTWSEVLYKSFQVGFIKKLDLDFYLDLQSAVSKRLYRYLDKHFWYKSRIQVDLFVLAHEKIGISRNYKYVSSLRQQLDPAIKELMERGFISGCEYINKSRGADVVFFAPSKAPTLPTTSTNADSTPKEILISKLIERGVRAVSAEKSLAQLDEAGLERVDKIITYFDKLRATGSSLVNRNPAGFLFRAVSDPFVFSLPDDSKRAPKKPLSLKPQTPEVSKSSLEGEFLIVRKREIERLRNSMEEGVLKRLEEEVVKALSNIQSLISPEKFVDAVRHGVDEKIAKLFALPTYSEWLKQKPKD